MAADDPTVPDTSATGPSDVQEHPVAAAFAPPSPQLRVGIAAGDRVMTDPDAPVIIGVSFDRMVRAQEYLLAMSGLREDGALDLKDAVVVSKDANGSVRVVETMDPTPGKAALSAGLWTGLLGLFIAGPVGWIAGMGIGAGAGAIAAKVVDLGVPDEWVAWFKQAVRPGTSTVVILAEHVHVNALAAEASRFEGAELLYTSMPDSAYEQLVEAFEPKR